MAPTDSKYFRTAERMDQALLRLLERKHLRVQVISRSKEPDGVTLHLRREYNGYSVGDYLKNEEEEA